MLLDLHMHSEYSNDAKPNASVEAICRTAAQRGFSVIALTDHQDYFYQNEPLIFDVEARQRDIARCQSEYAGALTILTGAEVGQVHAGTGAEAFIEAYAFDVVIGSLHVRRSNDTDIYFQPFAELDYDQFLDEYFTELLALACHGGFDVLAHIDYPLRVMKLADNHPTFVGWEERIAQVLRAIIERDIALEINAAGLFGWQKQVGPPRFVLDLYKNLGGSLLSIGSDSHCAPDVGRGIAECIAHAKDAGFHEITMFQNRKPQTVSI